MRHITLLLFLSIAVLALVLSCDDRIEFRLKTKELLMEKVIEAVNSKNHELLFDLYDTEKYDQVVKDGIKGELKKWISAVKKLKLQSKEIFKIEDYEDLDRNKINDEKIIKNPNVTHVIKVIYVLETASLDMVFPVYKKKGFWYITINENL